MSKTLSVVIDSYEKDWKKKNVYFTIWNIIQKSDWNESIKLNTIMTNYLKRLFWKDFEWWVNIFENDNSNTKDNSEKTSNVDEDLPF